MIVYSAASKRVSDGAQNLVIMNGKAGYLGYSKVYLKYLEDGWISLTGDNSRANNAWKQLSVFSLEPGKYTLTGLKNVGVNKVALQLYIKDDTGVNRYIYQWDEDVTFKVESNAKATLHVRVFPHVENIDIKARPAVYRDE